MGKKTDDTILDAPWDKIIAECDLMVVCEGEPADFNDANALKGAGGVRLASNAMTAGEFSKADGDVSGRKLVIAALAAVTAEANGNGDHVALLYTGGTVLQYVTTTAAIIAVVTGTPFPLGSWKAEFQDPV